MIIPESFMGSTKDKLGSDYGFKFEIVPDKEVVSYFEKQDGNYSIIYECVNPASAGRKFNTLILDIKTSKTLYYDKSGWFSFGVPITQSEWTRKSLITAKDLKKLSKEIVK